MPLKNQHLNNSSGFTLLEVMVAMLIFAVGMLGLAGIQAISLQNNNTAYLRTIAMQQSYNMSDLLRSSTDFNGVVDSNFDAISSPLGSAPHQVVFLMLMIPALSAIVLKCQHLIFTTGKITWRVNLDSLQDEEK